MVYSFDLNMTPGGVPQIIKLSQYDKTIPELQATLWLDNAGYSIPSGASIYIAGTKPDKTGFEYQLSGSGSTITIPITEQMTAVAGRVKCELIIRSSTGRKGSCNFFLDIEPAALNADIIPSETEIPIIEQIPEIVQEMENNVELAHQWATYGSESETPSETNNAKYWAEQSEQYAIGAFHWKGSVLFANIPTSGMIVGDLYDITDDFTTDSRFVEGAGIECAAGTDIVWSEGNKWDILTPATNASQVKYGDSDVKTELDQINTSLTDINSNLSDLQLVINSSNNVQFPSETTITVYYTEPLLADHTLVSTTPRSLGDDRVHLRGVYADYNTQRIYVELSNPMSVSTTANITFYFLLAKSVTVTDRR